MDKVTTHINGQWTLVKSKPEPIKDCTGCGKELHTGNAEFVGVQETPDHIPHNLHLHNCPDCTSTVARRVPKK